MKCAGNPGEDSFRGRVAPRATGGFLVGMDRGMVARLTCEARGGGFCVRGERLARYYGKCPGQGGIEARECREGVTLSDNAMKRAGWYDCARRGLAETGRGWLPCTRARLGVAEMSMAEPGLEGSQGPTRAA